MSYLLFVYFAVSGNEIVVTTFAWKYFELQFATYETILSPQTLALHCQVFIPFLPIAIALLNANKKVTTLPNVGFSSCTEFFTYLLVSFWLFSLIHCIGIISSVLVSGRGKAKKFFHFFSDTQAVHFQIFCEAAHNVFIVLSG